MYPQQFYPAQQQEGVIPPSMAPGQSSYYYHTFQQQGPPLQQASTMSSVSPSLTPSGTPSYAQAQVPSPEQGSPALTPNSVATPYGVPTSGILTGRPLGNNGPAQAAQQQQGMRAPPPFVLVPGPAQQHPQQHAMPPQYGGQPYGMAPGYGYKPPGPYASVNLHPGGYAAPTATLSPWAGSGPVLPQQQPHMVQQQVGEYGHSPSPLQMYSSGSLSVHSAPDAAGSGATTPSAGLAATQASAGSSVNNSSNALRGGDASPYGASAGSYNSAGNQIKLEPVDAWVAPVAAQQPMTTATATPGGGSPHAPNKSRFRGVSYDRKKGKWRVQIKVAALGKSGVSVGYYDTEEGAARAYDRAAIGLLGRDCATLQTNYPLEEYAGESIPRLAGKTREEVKSTLKSERIKGAPRRRFSSRQRTSRFMGVGSSNRKNQWQARILVHGRVTHLGYYETEESAAQVYDRVAIALHGAQAQTNFSASDYTPEELAPFKGLDREDLQRALGVKPMDKSSRFRGVSKKKGKWEAKVMVNRKWAYRELFDSEEEAARAYDRALWRLKPREARSYVNFKDTAPEGASFDDGSGNNNMGDRALYMGGNNDEDEEEDEEENDASYEDDGASITGASEASDVLAAVLGNRRRTFGGHVHKRTDSAPDLRFWEPPTGPGDEPVGIGLRALSFPQPTARIVSSPSGKLLGKRGVSARPGLPRAASEPQFATIKPEDEEGSWNPALGEVLDLFYDQDFFALDGETTGRSGAESAAAGGLASDRASRSPQQHADVAGFASPDVASGGPLDSMEFDTGGLLDWIKSMPDGGPGIVQSGQVAAIGKSRSAISLPTWSTSASAGELEDEEIDPMFGGPRPRKISKSFSLCDLHASEPELPRLGPLGRPIRRINTFTTKLATFQESTAEEEDEEEDRGSMSGSGPPCPTTTSANAAAAESEGDYLVQQLLEPSPAMGHSSLDADLDLLT